jgi:hypothetical protein
MEKPMLFAIAFADATFMSVGKFDRIREAFNAEGIAAWDIARGDYVMGLEVPDRQVITQHLGRNGILRRNGFISVKAMEIASRIDTPPTRAQLFSPQAEGLENNVP